MAVTYRNLYDVTLQCVYDLCVNVSNYDNVPIEMRRDASDSERFQGTAKSYIQYIKVTRTIVNPIPGPDEKEWTADVRVTKASVKQNFDDLLAKYNLLSVLDSDVTTRGLLKFFHIVALWSASNIKIAGGQLSTSRCVVYINGPVQEVAALKNVPEANTITATDINTLTQTIIEIISANTKGYLVRYTEKLSVE